MKKGLLLISGLIVASFFTSCRENPCSIFNPDRCHIMYNFKFDYKTSPIMDTISVGDTFFFEMTVPHIAEDSKTGFMYDVSQLPFDLKFSPQKLDIQNRITQSSFPGDFTYLQLPFETEIIVQNAGPHEIVTFDFVDKGTYRYSTFGVIPNIKGHFYFSPAFDRARQSDNNDRDAFSLTDTCCQQSVFTELLYNNGEGNNLEWLGDNLAYDYKNSNIIYDYGDDLYRVYDCFVIYVEE